MPIVCVFFPGSVHNKYSFDKSKVLGRGYFGKVYEGNRKSNRKKVPALIAYFNKYCDYV